MKKIVFIVCFCYFGIINFSSADTIYAVVNADTATIWHKEYHTSCSSSFMMDFRLTDNHIDLFEIDTSGGSYCLCYFDLNTEIGSLATGLYTVDVYEVYWPYYSYSNPTDTTFLGNTTFTIQGNPASTPTLLSNNTSDCYQNVGLKELPPAIESDFSITSINPNPAYGIADIVLNIPKQYMLELKVFDETGRLVDVIIKERIDKGIQHVRWDVSCLPSGLYLIQLSGNHRIVTRKVLVAN
jgi:hypothetical protein